MTLNNSTDSHRCQESHEIAGHVGDAHQSSGKVWGDVDVIGVEAAVVEAVEADSDAQQGQNSLVLATDERKAD